MFDDDFIYVSGRCWDSAPPDKWIANEMRRDTNQLRQNDMFGVLLRHVPRSPQRLHLLHESARRRSPIRSITDEGNLNADWNPVWEVRTGRFEGGWTVEMAIPFKSLRYTSGTNQTWGIQLRRAIRRKNEWTHLTALPASTAGRRASSASRAAATLVGLDLPPASKNIEIKPYGISQRDDRPAANAGDLERSRRRRRRRREVRRDREPDRRRHLQHRFRAGRSRRAAGQPDAVQPALSREARLLPRGARHLRLRPAAAASSAAATPADDRADAVLQPPHRPERRTASIPIDVGGRVTGKVGKFSVGAAEHPDRRRIGVAATPATNFTVVRVKRDILRRSSVGAMFTNRSESSVGRRRRTRPTASMRAFSFFQNVNLGGYYARTETPGLEGRRRQLPGPVRLRRRSVRRAGSTI